MTMVALGIATSLKGLPINLVRIKHTNMNGLNEVRQSSWPQFYISLYSVIVEFAKSSLQSPESSGGSPEVPGDHLKSP
jgi:hypothetical protein